MLVGGVAAAMQSLSGETVSSAFRPDSHVLGEGRLLLEGAHACPEGGFDALRMGCQERLGGVRVPYTAVVLGRFVVCRRPHHPVTFRAGNTGWGSRHVCGANRLGASIRIDIFNHQLAMFTSFSWSSGVGCDQIREIGDGPNMLRIRR